MRILLPLLLSFVVPSLLRGAEEKVKDAWHITHQKTLPRGYVIETIGYSKHPSILYAAGWPTSDFPVYGYTIEKGRPLRQYRELLHRGVQAISCSPTGLVATGSSDKTVKLWSKDGEELYMSKEEDEGVYTVDFSSDSNNLVCGTNAVKVLDCKTWKGKQVYQVEAPVMSARYSPDNNTVAAGLDNGTMKLIDLRTRKIIKSIKAKHSANQYPNPAIHALDWSPGAGTIVFGDRNGIIHALNIRAKNLKRVAAHPKTDYEISRNDEVVPIKTTSDIYTVNYSPGGEYIATGSFDTTIKLWDSKTLACLCTLKAHEDSVRSIAWITDDTFASGSYDGTIKIWKKNNTSVSDDEEERR